MARRGGVDPDGVVGTRPYTGHIFFSSRRPAAGVLMRGTGRLLAASVINALVVSSMIKPVNSPAERPGNTRPQGRAGVEALRRFESVL